MEPNYRQIIKDTVSEKALIIKDRLRLDNIWFEHFVKHIGWVAENQAGTMVARFTLKEFLDNYSYNYKLLRSRSDVDFLASYLKNEFIKKVDFYLRMEIRAPSAIFCSGIKRCASKVFFEVSFPSAKPAETRTIVPVPYSQILKVLSLEKESKEVCVFNDGYQSHQTQSIQSFLLWDYVETNILKPAGYTVINNHWDIAQQGNKVDLICYNYKVSQDGD